MKMPATEADEAPTADFCGLGLSDLDMEDVWCYERRADKFGDCFELLDGRALSDFDVEDVKIEDILDWSIESMERREIVHHDCMWAGTCEDKFHSGPRAEPEAAPPPAPTPPPAPAPRPALAQPAQAGRSLLLPRQPPPRPARRAPERPPTAPPSPRRPDTPQSLDEEEPPRRAPEARAPATRGKRMEGEPDDAEDVEDEEEEEDDDEEEEEEEYRRARAFAPRPGGRDARALRESTIASDHSYTLSKGCKQARVELLGVQTPSDSEEEIDVVSLGEKMVVASRTPAALPSNPSPLARRQLQRTMASAVAERAGLGARPPPPQPRKRPRERSASPLMRHRKKPKPLAKPRFRQPSPPKRRPCSSPNSDSEAENIERRSLHNDMERQRRIGLKNLFDELKTEVPSISQKERAPKVVVLREAAALCSRLQREDREMEQLKAKQQRLLARVRQLRLDLASRRPRNA